jgi:hypothetical protein
VVPSIVNDDLKSALALAWLPMQPVFKVHSYE